MKNQCPSINVNISLAKAQRAPREKFKILLKQSVNALRALRLGESLLLVDGNYLYE
jgi:hypothetical protein